MSERQPVVVSIAGSDNSGGAGIQADIKTCTALGVYSATVVTAITAQNSRHVYAVDSVSVEMVKSQFDAILETIRPDAIKIGMLPSPDIICAVAGKIREYGLKNVVVDPVMVATNGDSLTASGHDMISAFTNELFPLSALITPNIPEARKLLGLNSDNELDSADLCIELYNICNADSVLLKGGHGVGHTSIDYLYNGTQMFDFETERVNSVNTHGTGCTLSSAIAAGLAKGYSLTKAISEGKNFVYNAIKFADSINVAKGPGPLNFMWNDIADVN